MTDKIIFTNTQGFLNKEFHINKIVRDYQPIVLVIAEHFQCDPKKLDKIIGYRLHAVFCRGARERGGVAVFVRIDIDVVVREDLDAHSEKNEFEVASVEIPSRNLVVTAVYRPPKSSRAKFNLKLDAMLKHYNEEIEKLHLMAGDFNIDNTKTNTTEQVLSERGFKFMLSTVTHEHGACLDNFIVDFDPSKTRVMRARIDQVSDHCPIELILPKSKKKSRTNFFHPFKTYRKSSEDKPRDDLEEEDDDDSLSDYSDLSEDVRIRVSKLSDILDAVALSTNDDSEKQVKAKQRMKAKKRNEL